MLKKTALILIIILFYSINVHAEGNSNIEIFDITKGKVVKVLHVDSKIEEIAINYLKGINCVHGKFNPIPKEGYAIAIPLKTSVKIQGKWLNAFVNEVIIMFPKLEPPFLVVIDNDDRLVCFGFKGDTEFLLKILNFKLN